MGDLEGAPQGLGWCHGDDPPIDLLLHCVYRGEPGALSFFGAFLRGEPGFFRVGPGGLGFRCGGPGDFLDRVLAETGALDLANLVVVDVLLLVRRGGEELGWLRCDSYCSC